ncbi:mechanosensitive ion channel domain-containing protein [Candidatus Latescibacterota bacterium]
MNNDTLEKLIYSIIAWIIITALLQLIKFYTRKTQKKLKLKKSRYFAIRRFMTLFSALLIIIILVFIWGININNMWVSLTGFVAMIAVAFFAVWSLLGNILAGLILFFTSPFKIDDTIEIMPDEIKGKVLAINSFYTLLIDDDENYINIPNSLLFQKYIKSIQPMGK